MALCVIPGTKGETLIHVRKANMHHDESSTVSAKSRDDKWKEVERGCHDNRERTSWRQ